ncbi:oocyte zinc finger protein XlCOF7.1-like [Scomber scombrus]|uniref:oocyte zinc finger protein XlCOF7.1-like n=1 Tax=Scomber scombrus TaxID=13677 RepID=UPI002DD7B010|nr:oocyte zinc finger protein XlCOF7.1-like [Scomber scombrus]
MSKVQMLRASVNQRLTAAAEEIFVLFERTIAEYEEELSRSKEENERQRKLLDAVFKPQLHLHRADVQQPFENKEEVPGSSVDQEDPDPSHIKKEQKELWTSQEGEQLPGLEEVDITKFTSTPVPVKSEDDKQKPQSSQLHQTLTEEMETEADGEDCGGSEPDRNSHPDTHLLPDTDDSDGDWTETGELQSDLNSLKNTEVLVSDMKCNTGSVICSQCDAKFASKETLQRHLTLDHCSGTNLFSCQLCDKTFSHRTYLKSHMSLHKGVKRFICRVCKEGFAWRSQLKTHKCVDKTSQPNGEESEAARNSVCVKEVRCGEAKVSVSSFSCSECKESFEDIYSLEKHLRDHKRKKPFSCPFCVKSFENMSNQKSHIAMHTGEKPLSCQHCDKRFTWSSELKVHRCVHPRSSQLHQSQTEEDREAELQEPKEADSSRFMFISDAVKSENDESKPQSSQLHQSQTEQMETEAGGEDCGGSEPDPDRYLQPISDDEASEFERSGDDETEDSSLSLHMQSHSVKEPLQCPLCPRMFQDQRGITNHLIIHAGGKRPFPCQFCETLLASKKSWLKHVKSHFWP